MEEEKKKKNRRTFACIDRDIMAATKKIIERDGFTNATLSAIIHEAGIEPNTFYRRFENLEALFDFFIRKYDYFLENAIDEPSAEGDYVEFYRNCVVGLARQLYVNKSMQKILLWELSDDNEMTIISYTKIVRHFEVSISPPSKDTTGLSRL